MNRYYQVLLCTLVVWGAQAWGLVPFEPCGEHPGTALWEQQTAEMLRRLPIDIQGGASYASSYTFHELPRWIPFESFSIGNHIFINERVKGELVAFQRAVVGHELWHAYHTHTIKQLGYGALFVLSYYLGITRLHRNSTYTQATSRSVRTAIAAGIAYLWYALFHKICVRPLELEAEAGNAKVLGNQAAAVAAHMPIYDLQHDTDSGNLCLSIENLLFRMIAPFHPTEAELLKVCL